MDEGVSRQLLARICRWCDICTSVFRKIGEEATTELKGLQPGLDEPPLQFELDMLLCPLCGGNCLHHERVEIWNRWEEDAEICLHIVADDNLADRYVINESIEGNPSDRRDGMAISFWCERCNKHSTLLIAQHKGQTIIDWEGIEDGSDDSR